MIAGCMLGVRTKCEVCLSDRVSGKCNLGKEFKIIVICERNAKLGFSPLDSGVLFCGLTLSFLF